MHEKLLNEFVKNYFGKDFEFRQYQKETILDIVECVLNNEKSSYILEAPTGSGKSIIAMCISGVLNLLNKKGYILASDLALHTQYENDIQKYKLPFGYVKGIDNYLCSENGEKHSLGECHIRNTPSKHIKTLSCYPSCEYYFRRDHAMTTDTSVLTYSYWLIQRNYVAKNNDYEPFQKRDFIICDEAHKITDIVQNHFSPSINLMTQTQLEKLRRFIVSKEFGKVNITESQLSKNIDLLFKENNPNKLINHLLDFEYQLEQFKEKADLIKEFIAKKYAFKTVPKDWRYGLFLCDWLKDMHCKFEDYNIIIKNSGISSLIKNPGEEGVVFNCLDESYLMKKHFHDECGHEILMSATIGDPKSYMKNTKVDDARFIRIRSTFDFEKSPIYAFTGKKMSYGAKEESFPWVIEKIKEILEIHKEESGIIHTGSYAFSRNLYDKLPTELRKRILFYSNSKEKKDCLEEFYQSYNKVLIGPSLTTGIDLPDMLSRFQLFMKVPYASLADRFVNAKMKQDNSWYSEKCIIEILQGMGRSIRHENDWCKTYILDGCFVDLFKRSQNSFPPEFKDRIVWVQHNDNNWFDKKPFKIPF